ncbi:MAG: SPOR domain-containing protein [Rhodobacteraceae bacterium]|nr:SPOR domain-containing protein [Paracoccaceae bacterium]
MAEANFEDFGDAAPALRAGQTQRLINLAGGATSVALMLGLAVWGYRLAMRDVNGIPVIHAMEGPMRMAPEDPGGQIADNLGLTVNRVAADALGQTPTDKLVLAPGPISLTPQDIAPAARVAATPAPAVVPAAAAVATPAPLVDAPATPAPAQASASVAAPAPEPVPVVAAAAPDAHGAPTTSPRPMARPKALAAMPASAPAAAPKVAKAAAVPDSVDPATIVAGTRLVQLGAFDSPDVATSSWALLKARFGDLLADKSRVVQKATSGGRDFYRLRAYGFKDDAEARRFCAALDAANAPCVPVLVR